LANVVHAPRQRVEHALGLERLRHGDASSIDIHTLRAAISVLPTELLESCGLSSFDVMALRTVRA